MKCISGGINSLEMHERHVTQTTDVSVYYLCIARHSCILIVKIVFDADHDFHFSRKALTCVK